MAPITQQHTKPKRKLPRLFDFDTESLESVKEFTSGVTSSFKRDVAEEGARDLMHQLLGKYEKTSQKVHKLTGDLAEGEEIELGSHHDNTPTPKRPDAAPGLEHYNYHRDIIRSSERSSLKENHEMERQVEEIIVEIKELVHASKELESEFKEMAVTQTPVEVGKYHTKFFEWVLITIRQARMKVEDSGSWLSTMNSKKGKKNYWSMFKKHGTSFGMSNERSVATQTG